MENARKMMVYSTIEEPIVVVFFVPSPDQVSVLVVIVVTTAPIVVGIQARGEAIEISQACELKFYSLIFANGLFELIFKQPFVSAL